MQVIKISTNQCHYYIYWKTSPYNINGRLIQTASSQAAVDLFEKK